MKFRIANEIATKIIEGSIPHDEQDRLLLELNDLMLERYIEVEVKAQKQEATIREYLNMINRMEANAAHWRKQYVAALDHLGLPFESSFQQALDRYIKKEGET